MFPSLSFKIDIQIKISLSRQLSNDTRISKTILSFFSRQKLISHKIKMLWNKSQRCLFPVMISPEFVDVNNGGEGALMIVHGNQLVLVKADQVESGWVERTLRVVLPLWPLHVVQDGNLSQMLSCLDVKEHKLGRVGGGLEINILKLKLVLVEKTHPTGFFNIYYLT